MQRRPAFRQIGLTGGIGSGKSTVAASFAQCGAALIDADALSRSLTAVGGAALPAIAARFGDHMLQADGALDRDAMRAQVFSDPTARAQLEAIMHPLVGQSMQAAVQAAQDQGAALAVLDIPLLVESRRWPAALDAVVVVDCLPDTQLARVMQRSGLSAEAVRAIMASQASRAQRLAAADAVIYNEGCSLAALHQQVAFLAAEFGL
ncbi:dephospho-CoA kinase [Curvibacter sp. HBC61]|uniref:Dephospho-CoA kinase n=1 Tax=Curvibacter cyanobacteriorum TaxID=3026422 RepID=A0ABT5N138_9BURK|nr:dephospho-CoA kinase [Curvibacter sp. HBC61]MDD0839226.1 dephospho-CoA kinase [Curvibacter sp. HBC61]